jgi:hypothetical protein
MLEGLTVGPVCRKCLNGSQRLLVAHPGKVFVSGVEPREGEGSFLAVCNAFRASGRRARTRLKIFAEIRKGMFHGLFDPVPEQ